MKNIMILLCIFAAGCSTSKSLIDENSMKGWRAENGGKWEVRNGVMHGSKEASIDKHCLLISEEKFSNFILELEYFAVKDNSGFYFRLQPDKNPVGYKGFHVEIDEKGKNAGGIFDVAVKWLIKPTPELASKAHKTGDWNKMIIKAVGKKITVLLNGHTMSTLESERSFKGALGIQLHANENTQIKFRNINITEL